jgi:transcriptional regulator with XRE-family HTH domain
MQDAQLVTVDYADIIFDEGIYPRVAGHDPSLVQVYAREIDQIEGAGKFISINQENKLLDGRHRHLAYKKNADGRIDFQVKVWRYPVSSPLASLKLACFLQDKGRALDENDNEENAKKLYALGAKQTEIAETLSLKPSTISGYLSRTIKEQKERQKKQVYDLWLACHTQEEIAERVGVTHQTVSNWITEYFAKSSDNEVFAKFQDSDFQRPIYNVWKIQDKSNKVGHFGNTEARWLENLLYLYTEPFDIVVDPFAGGGSTIDVCKKRGRRYYVSDRKPIVERETEIRRWDITNGLPNLPRWKDVKLIYLDPPYWKQAEGKYSNDPHDLANMSLNEFNSHLSALIASFSKKLNDAYISLIIQPTQWNAPDRIYTDHGADMIKAVNLPIHMRFQCPYESQQCNAQMVEWGKENKVPLVLSREMIIWRVN